MLLPCLVVHVEREEAHAEDCLWRSISGQRHIENLEREGQLTHTKVAGRKARVTTAMVFIDALSLLAALLISTVALLSR